MTRRPSLSRIAATAAALLIVVGCSDDDAGSVDVIAALDEHDALDSYDSSLVAIAELDEASHEAATVGRTINEFLDPMDSAPVDVYVARFNLTPDDAATNVGRVLGELAGNLEQVADDGGRAEAVAYALQLGWALSAGDPRGSNVDERVTWLLSRDELDALNATDRDRLVTSLEGTGSDAASIFSDVSDEDGPGGIVARSFQEISETIATAHLDHLLSAWNASQGD